MRPARNSKRASHTVRLFLLGEKKYDQGSCLFSVFQCYDMYKARI